MEIAQNSVKRLFMEKRIILLIFLLFFTIIVDYAGNNIFYHAWINGTSAASVKTITDPNSSVRYSPEDVGMSSVTLTRIDSIVKEGM